VGSVGLSTSGLVLYSDVQILKLLNNTYIGMQSINDTFNGIANYISDRMRQWNYLGSGEYNKAVIGDVLITETCIQVHWPWITYPGVVALLAVLFFLCMLLQTEWADRADGLAKGWRSWLLPLICHPI